MLKTNLHRPLDASEPADELLAHLEQLHLAFVQAAACRTNNSIGVVQYYNELRQNYE